MKCKSFLVSRIERYLGASTNGKSGVFGAPIWRFESSRPSHKAVVKARPAVLKAEIKIEKNSYLALPSSE